jgi:hypothetical protein
MIGLNETGIAIDQLIKCGILEGNRNRNELRPTVEFLCVLYKWKGRAVGFDEYAMDAVWYHIDDPEEKNMRTYLHLEVRNLIQCWTMPLIWEGLNGREATDVQNNFLDSQTDIVCELIRKIADRREDILLEKMEEEEDKEVQ